MRLCRALGNKRIQVRTCTDRFAALAMLCRAERDEGASLAILLLVEPTQLRGSIELIELAGVYAPRSVGWLYTGTPAEQVREIREADLAAWRQRSVERQPAEVVVTMKHEPSLRIVSGADEGRPGIAAEGPGQERADPRAARVRMEGEGRSEEDPEPVLTDEELSMLLADEFGEHDRNGGRG